MPETSWKVVPDNNRLRLYFVLDGRELFVRDDLDMDAISLYVGKSNRTLAAILYRPDHEIASRVHLQQQVVLPSTHRPPSVWARNFLSGETISNEADFLRFRF